MSTRPHRWWMKATAAALVSVALSGCRADISPQPEPPVRQDIFDVDFGQVEAKVDSNTNAPSGLRGEAGSAKPAGATLRVINLDSADDPVDTAIEQDGSFAVEFSVALGDEVRLQILTDQSRSDPFDVWVEADEAPPTPVTRALGQCLKLTPPLELVLSAGTGSIRVDNDCAESVELRAPFLRRPVSGLLVGAAEAWPVNLPPGGSITVGVGVDGSTPLPLSEVVFIEALSPESDRRPVTVRSPD